MLKTISAVLIAVSVLAAPALAAGLGKTTQVPVIKTEKTAQAKPSLRNANAKMSHHRSYHRRHRHHQSHKRLGALRTRKLTKVSTKHTMAAGNRA
jgi:hypothetical protein